MCAARPLHRRESGFATVVAVIMIALAAVAAAALATSFVHQVRRTSDNARQAQLRQRLLAGTAWTQAHLAEIRPDAADPANPTLWPINLPAELASKATLQATIPPAASPTQRTATLRASFDGLSAAQALHFVPHGNAWRLTQAQWQSPGPTSPP